MAPPETWGWLSESEMMGDLSHFCALSVLVVKCDCDRSRPLDFRQSVQCRRHPNRVYVLDGTS